LLGADGGAPAARGPVPTGAARELAQRADEAFREYLRLQAERKFEEAARKLDELSRLLQRLAGDEGEREQPAAIR
ncbi:MAG TPA: hypothetical protein VLW45_05705, partial [Pelomicrobium sp.]|nr:hypothetical protein [Pelomicrobium sp.]